MKAGIFAALLLAFLGFSRAEAQSFDPNSLVKNPYQFKGHSGILNTNGTPVLMPNGAQLRGTLIPFACMRFEKMLDEHTAMFEVEAYEDGTLMPQGELAVLVSDSVAPDPSRRWRIVVEGPLQGRNGYGAKITVTAIRFEGYYVPPPPTPEELAQQAAARKALEAQREAAEKAEAEAKAAHHEAVEQEIERREAAQLEQDKQGHQQQCDVLAKAEAANRALNNQIAAANFNSAWGRSNPAAAAAYARSLATAPSYWQQHCGANSPPVGLDAMEKVYIRNQVEQEMGR